MDKHSLSKKIQANKNAIKGIVALLLLWYVLKSIDIKAVFLILKKSDFLVLGLAFLLAIFNQIIISNYKWAVLLRMYEKSLSFGKLCNMYLVGMFFSIFLPGAYGGDVVRAYNVAKYMEKAVEGVMSVVLERLTGLAGLLLILLAGLLFIDQSILSPTLKNTLILLIVLFFASIPLILSRNIARSFSFIFKYTGEKVENLVKEIYESLSILKYKKILILTGGLSLLFQFLVVVTNYMIALSLNVEISFTYLLFAIPVISLVTMIPVTLSGIGLRDISYIGFLSAAGIEKEMAFSIGLIAFLMGVLMSLYGGLIYFREK